MKREVLNLLYFCILLKTTSVELSTFTSAKFRHSCKKNEIADYQKNTIVI